MLQTHAHDTRTHRHDACRTRPCASRRCRALLLSALPAARPGPQAADAEVPGEVLVKLRSTPALGPLLVKYQLSLVSQFGARPIYRLKVVGAGGRRTTRSPRCELEPDVLIAEPNVVQQQPRGAQEQRLGDRHARGLRRAVGAAGAAPGRSASRCPPAPACAWRCSTPASTRAHPALAGRLLPRLRLRRLRQRSRAKSARRRTWLSATARTWRAWSRWPRPAPRSCRCACSTPTGRATPGCWPKRCCMRSIPTATRPPTTARRSST